MNFWWTILAIVLMINIQLIDAGDKGDTIILGGGGGGGGHGCGHGGMGMLLKTGKKKKGDIIVIGGGGGGCKHQEKHHYIPVPMYHGGYGGHDDHGYGHGGYRR
ncbi:hypothetical protein RDWZM_007037 [Blomia tropicalis]|uniref:Uncharacterized protein n=1 Tax=Blomia tropicalis TaxID=40697 RepID=A0A9Q0MCF7_BLOTA|nr:hypothetical protein BLOT_015531 [Blomia tropicalis]KAJ6221225.1 hypothetical protein RDWZM_007037 [Blomia tropicalis]